MPDSSLYLLDTNVISHIMRDGQGSVARRYAARLKSPTPCRMATSVVVECELRFGLEKRPSRRLQAAFDLQMQQLPVMKLDQTVAPRYASIRADLERAGTPIDANDLLIAAHALALGAILVSADAVFSRVPGLQVENWMA